jgi:cysteine desulfuration protein SufE
MSAHPLGKIDEVLEEFAELEPRERLEALLDYSDHIPPLPQRYQAEKAAGLHRVHECQTPVYLWVNVVDGKVEIHGDVAPEAPTVKGFVALLITAFSGSTPSEVLATPNDLLQRLGLIEALGMTRTRGLYAILHRIREEVRRAVACGATVV